MKRTSFQVNDKMVHYNTIWNYMMGNYAYHVDPICDVLNTTSLAEDAAEFYDWYDPNGEEFTPAEELFEIAHDVSQKLINTGHIQE